MSAPVFAGRLGLQQRVGPDYRRAFFDLLAQSCQGGLSLLTGQPRQQESITTLTGLNNAHLVQVRNRHFSDPQSPYYLCWQAGLLDWLESWDPQALIVEANPRYLSTRRAVTWMHARRRPVLGWGLGAPRGGNFAERTWRRAFLRSLDGLIAYSQRGAAEYRALGLAPVFVAPNAVAPRPEHPLPPRRPDFAGQPRLLFVGRLQARKRLDILLRACASLPPELKPKLVIVGDGPARLEFEALAAALYPQTEFTGARHGAELEPYFRQADLFALPGTGGLAIQQAMSFGLPVIVAQGDGSQADLVRPGNGWQVPPADQAAFEAALRDALSDASRLRHMGAESYRIVRAEINLQAMVAAFITAINQVGEGLHG